jgi:arylsulfatase A-like enzyme
MFLLACIAPEDPAAHNPAITWTELEPPSEPQTFSPLSPPVLPAPEDARNLLVITLDTTRRDQLGFFSGLDTTTGLDRFLNEALVLSNHHSCSAWTAPSMLCSVLGWMPYEEGWWPTAIYEEMNPDPEVPYIPAALPTLASNLQAKGYWTGLVTANGVFAPRSGGIGSGFSNVWEALWLPASAVRSRVYEAATEAMSASQPWYLHVHFTDPHTPYDAGSEFATEDLEGLPWNIDDPQAVYELAEGWAQMPPETQEKAHEFLMIAYRAQVRSWSKQFNALWYDLETMGVLENTLVVFWTDHGEQLGEHGEFFHGKSLHAEENRATAAFWAEGLSPGEFTGSTTHQDLPPTILSLLGLPPDPRYTGMAIDQIPEDRPLFAYNYLYGWDVPMLSVEQHGYKLLYSWRGDFWLYDVVSDPEEQQNLYHPNDPMFSMLWAVLKPEVERLYALWPHQVPTFP